MGVVITNSKYYEDIAEAIREKENTDATFKPSEMANEIKKNGALFRSIIERSITEITAEDLAGTTKIGARAFASCDKLKKVTLTDAIRGIGQAAFQYCTSLTDIFIPNVIDVETQAFHGCEALEEVVLPDSVGWVGSLAFADCKNLKRVTWSAKAPNLYGYCFGSCTSMEYIDFSRCTKVPLLVPDEQGISTSDSPISETPATCKFYVPANLLDEWKAAPYWKNYADRIMVKPPLSAYFVNNAGDSWEFYFEEGMTWAEAFAHPTYFASIEAVGHDIYTSGDCVYIGHTGDLLLCLASDKIMSGHQYSLGY